MTWHGTIPVSMLAYGPVGAHLAWLSLMNNKQHQQFVPAYISHDTMEKVM